MIESKAMEPQMSVDIGVAFWKGSGIEDPHTVSGGSHHRRFEGDLGGDLPVGREGVFGGVGGQPLGGLQHAPDEGLVAGVGEGDFEVGVGLGELCAVAQGDVEREEGFAARIGLDVGAFDGDQRGVTGQRQVAADAGAQASP
jgi:hypothetical protein